MFETFKEINVYRFNKNKHIYLVKIFTVKFCNFNVLTVITDAVACYDIQRY